MLYLRSIDSVTDTHTPTRFRHNTETVDDALFLTHHGNTLDGIHATTTKSSHPTHSLW